MKHYRILLVCLGLVIPGLLPAQSALSIDVSKTRAAISPYIYGQFIEHLGRCIYGGIWAEMLEDRKFYYAVTDTYAPWGTASDPNWNAGEFRHLVASPWKVIGPAGHVRMDTVQVFTGRHTPVLTLNGDQEIGISQEGLALVKKMRYDGRVVLAGEGQVGPVEVRLVLDDGSKVATRIEDVDAAFTPHTFRFTAPADAENAHLEIVGKGTGTLRIGAISLMPSDNLKGWRSDVVALLKELDSPIYRWPGGNFVSGYNWRDGIGPQDQRPPRKNPAWTGVEHNDVGLHEFMYLMDLIDSEPYIAVNTGLGTVEEVAEQVAYANAPADTKMGKLRAANGSPKPFGVRWWAVGNEMYGNWQLGHMPLSEYVTKHNAMAEAIWRADPDAKLVAVGEVGEWDETMLRDAGHRMNLISEHIYSKDKADVPEHITQLADMIRAKGDAHRNYRKEIPGLRQRGIRIAMDEWNYWYGDYVYGELGVRYHLKDALGVAAGLHEFFRNSDIYYMANYAQTVNVIGAIKTSRTGSNFDATGWPLMLYRKQFGTIPVTVDNVPAPFDVAAAWTEDRKAITVAVVNPTAETTTFTLDVPKAKMKKVAQRWTIAGNDPMMHDGPDDPARIGIKEESVRLGDDYRVEVPAYGIALYRIEAVRR